MSTCSNHSGHEQKIINLETKIVSYFNSIQWMLGIIITIILAINTGFVIALWDLKGTISEMKTKTVLYDKVLESKLNNLK